MAKDDYFKILYGILKELYETKKAGEKVDLQAISPERYRINKSYWLDIICEAEERGYIKNILIRESKTGRYPISMEDIEITMEGIGFLEENSMMKKVAKALATVKDIAPGI